MRKLAKSAIATGMLALSVLSTTAVYAADVCKEPVRILAQPRDAFNILDQHKDEFKALSGSTFSIDYLTENDRRAKSRADASTVGKYNVYYVDEANIVLFASSKWILPLTDYYPKEYDFDDFDPGRRKIATYDGKIYFAPILGGGNLLFYRKDLFEKAGLQPPKSLDEIIADVPKLHDPSHNIYGITLRGQRGSGANVWGWMPYFVGLGGKWFDGDKPVFNSDAAVRATQIYLDLFKYSAPGTKTGNWDEETGSFLGGQVAMIMDGTIFAAMVNDPKLSQVVGKAAYVVPPPPLVGTGYAHGFAIGAKANKDEDARKCAGLFIAWATSKEQEQLRLDAGQFSELNRTSIMTSDKFKKTFGPELADAIKAAAPITTVTFWQDADWPALGDRWGIMLEELITGSRTDIKGSLDELEVFAKELVAKKKT